MSEPAPGFEWLAVVKYLWLVIAGVFTWIFKEHIADDKQRAKELAEVRETYATRDDISQLHQKIDDNHREVMRVLTRD
jgi:hypothetical protein